MAGTAATADEIVEGWIAHTLSDDADEKDRLSWAWDLLFDLVIDDPEAAWPIVLALVDAADGSDRLRANVAAGPLEELLIQHGEQFIERVEAEARRPGFRKCLRGAWLTRGKPEVRRRIEAALGDEPKW